jgi:hypothetical protein
MQVDGLFRGEHGARKVPVVIHPYLNGVSAAGCLDVQLRSANALNSHHFTAISINPTRIMAPMIPQQNTKVFSHMT